MAELFTAAAGMIVVLMMVCVGRLTRGPREEDRLVTASLFGTMGVAVLLLLAEARLEASFQDVAAVLAVLTALATMVFVTRGNRGEARGDG